jgi:hypothetical protein
MSNLVFAKSPDVENIIANDLRDFLVNEVKFDELFPGNNVKISTDHPFVDLMQQDIPESGSYDLTTGFPSVTVIDTNFDKLIETSVNPKSITIEYAIMAEINKYGRDQFIMSKQTKKTLEETFAANDNANLHGTGYETHRKTHVAIEIWAQNNLLKSKLFDLVSLFLINGKKFELHTNKGVTVEDYTITGERSGIYNFDFGEILYGAMLRFDVAYQVGYYTISDDTIILGGANVVLNNNELI